MFFRPSAPPQPLRRLHIISFFSPPGAATTASKVKCHYFFLRPSCAATAAAQFACHLLFSAHLRRHSRCEVCVSSLFSNSRHRHSRCECLGSFLFFRLPAPPRPLRSLSVMSAVCPPGAASTGAKCECRLFFPPSLRRQQLLRSLSVIFFFRPPAPQQPLRSLRDISVCCPPAPPQPLRSLRVIFFRHPPPPQPLLRSVSCFPFPCATQYQAGVVFVSCSFFLSC